MIAAEVSIIWSFHNPRTLSSVLLGRTSIPLARKQDAGLASGFHFLLLQLLKSILVILVIGAGLGSSLVPCAAQSSVSPKQPERESNKQRSWLLMVLRRLKEMTSSRRGATSKKLLR